MGKLNQSGTCAAGIGGKGPRTTSVIRQDQSIEINGYSVPVGGCVIHFYYTKAEQQRLLGFLLEGAARREGVVMACAEDDSEALSDGLEMLGVRRSEHEIMQVEITSNVRASIDAIAAAAKDALGARPSLLRPRALRLRFHDRPGGHRRRGGLVELRSRRLEPCLSDPIRRPRLRSPDHHRSVPNPRAGHRGTAFFCENRHYASPEAYVRKRAAGGRK